ncbi:MAG TPA: hypothetical protein VFV52_01730 [Bacilli bacterium]|nr:hypothetical protein [Bacilli bacterium]
MKVIRQDVQANDVRQDVAHTLFVEGEIDSIDRPVLKLLLEDRIRVEGMGASYSLSNVADALHPHHPKYYFLIDRDGHTAEEVEKHWASFPNPDHKNLLIWRRKELENYFLLPDFVVKSKYMSKPQSDFIQRLEQEAQQRIYFEAVNRVIILMRRELQTTWIRKLSGPQGLETKEQAQQKIVELRTNACAQKLQDDVAFLEQDNLMHLFDEQVRLLLGEEETCKYGAGQWLELMAGKKLLNLLVDYAFIVHDRHGNELHGKEKLRAIVKDLLALPPEELPQDFQDLRRLIFAKID